MKNEYSQEVEIILKTNAFKEKLRQAMKSLNNNYIPVECRYTLKTVLDFLEICGIEDLHDTKSELFQIRNILLDRVYIKKHTKNALRKKIEQYVDAILDTKDATTEINQITTGVDNTTLITDDNRNESEEHEMDNLQKLVHQLANISIEDNCDNCFTELTNDGIHDDFSNILVKSGIHSWKCITKAKKMLIYGESDKNHFTTQFKAHYDLNRYKVDTVLQIFEHHKEVKPNITEQTDGMNLLLFSMILKTK